MEKLSMTSKEALDVLIDAKFCRNAEHENEVNEAIDVLKATIVSYIYLTDSFKEMRQR